MTQKVTQVTQKVTQGDAKGDANFLINVDLTPKVTQVTQIARILYSTTSVNQMNCIFILEKSCVKFDMFTFSVTTVTHP